MKSSEFLAEGDDKNIADVQANHPEIYKFLVSIVGWPALVEHGKVETYNTGGNHMVVISIQPSAGLGNTEAALEQASIPYKKSGGSLTTGGDTILSGGVGDDTNWNVKARGTRGNIEEIWRFGVPLDEPATYHDRSMD